VLLFVVSTLTPGLFADTVAAYFAAEVRQHDVIRLVHGRVVYSFE
jgi:hypothetical protein